MEGILEGTIFFPSMVQQISTAAFPKMDKEGSAGEEGRWTYRSKGIVHLNVVNIWQKLSHAAPNAPALAALSWRNDIALKEFVIHREWDDGSDKPLDWLHSPSY